MNSQRGTRTLCRQYLVSLRRYLSQQQEEILQEAYDLGRTAIARGLGVVDIARIHQQALALSLLPELPIELKVRVLTATETFLVETLAPFEAAHRGFRDLNFELRQVNKALEAGNRELARKNRELEREIRERKRTARALQESKDHYRRLFHQARLMHTNLRNLSTQILHVQEEERKRVSRELHDEVGQAITAISTHLQMLQRNGSAGGQHHKQKILEAQTLLAQTMDTVHQFARELRPPMLDELGLVPALRSYLKGFADRTGLRVRFSCSGDAEDLSDEQKTVVYRVAQESLTNVAKHAQAGQLTVSFRKVARGVRVLIHDDGRGFRARQQLLQGNGKKRLGLLGMQERVRLVNGRFAVKSAPGEGTTVSVEIPFHEARGAAVANRSIVPKPLEQLL